MLKSIVNGAEHDIVSIPMKGKNLFPQDSFTGKTNAVRDTFNEIASSIVFNNGQYTISMSVTTEPTTGILKLCFTYTDDSQDKSAWVTKNTPTITLVSNGEKVVKSISITDYNNYTDIVLYDIMLNAGSTALPYEPYGYQNGWEIRDNQNRLIWGREDELQTTTGNLLFKGYDLPVKVNSLLGSADQNGTPSPDNVVVPEFCGVRTKNICPSATAETKTNNGITAVSNGSGTYHVSGTATADADIRFNVQSFLIPKSIDGSGSGTYSMFNSATYANADVKIVFYYQGTKVDDWGLTTLNRTSTTYAIMSEKDCDAIGFTVKSGVTVDFTISPEFTNDGILPTEFEPYGYKISFDNNGENLFDASLLQNNMHLDTTTGLPVAYTGRIASPNPVDVSQYSTVTISYVASTTINAMYSIFSNNGLVRRSTAVLSGTAIDVSNADKMYICFYSGVNIDTSSVSNIMLNSRSTPLPYSPYLNKTTPIYLGEVPTIRRIKKLVLTGEETNFYNKNDNSSNSLYFIRFAALTGTPVLGSPLICTHLINTPGTPSASAGINVGTSYQVIYLNIGLDIMNAQPSGNTVAGLKEYLTAQYANGTPVTVWYILSEQQTGIVNEPLAKIGDHADELTEISVHNLSAPLYGIGDYKDILNLSTGVLTRNIKKLVLTGNENWALWSSGQPDVERYYYKWGKSTPSDYGLISTHLPFLKGDGNFEHIRLGGSSRDDFVIFISKTIAPTVADFKSYLAAQYQAGTPVTAWYVISTPETETVTVPTGMTGEIEGYLTQISTPTPEHPSIPKWNGKEETGGTYAVTVYDLPEIPTTTGQNTLTVETEKIHGVTSPLCGIGDYKDVLNLSTGIITRKIKKWVLTGNETIGNYEGIIYLQLPDDAFQGTAIPFSTHYIGTDISIADSPNYSIRQIMTRYWGGIVPAIRIKDSSHNSSGLFQDFITTQYTAGTPVVIWYILSTPETETITVPYGLECSVEGYLTQSGIPTPSNPITPESNGILESGGTYAVEVSLVPSNLTVKGHIKPIQ